MNKISIVVLMLLLSSCASVNTYVEPQRGSGQPPLANISGNFIRHGFYDWQASRILAIDNKTINYGLFANETSTQIPVTPALHMFTIKASFLRGFANGPYDALVAVKAKLQPGMNYKVNGFVDGTNVKYWVEDANGRRVSMVTFASYSATPPAPMIIPIIIPTR